MNQGIYLHQANIANLQSDEITILMHSLIQNTRNLDDILYNQFICAHTVRFNQENELIYNNLNCAQCRQAALNPYRHQKTYQLSGILYFLSGGLENEQNQFNNQYHFFENFVFRDDFSQFQSQCRILNYVNYERIHQFYQVLQNNAVYREHCPNVIIYQLHRYYVIIENNYSPIFAPISDSEITFFQSYQELMRIQNLVENQTDFRFPLPCIHSLYIKQRSQNQILYYITYNIFYFDNLCNCQKTHGRALYHLLTHSTIFIPNYQEMNIVQNQFIDFAVARSNQNLTPTVFLQEMIQFQQNVRVLSSYIIGADFPISFQANSLFRKIRERSGNQLCCAYKIIFLQQTIELTEILIVRLRKTNPQFNDTTIYNNIIYLKKRQQVQRINDYLQNYQGDEIFSNLLNAYNEILDAIIIEPIEDIINNPLFPENGIQNQLYQFRIRVCLDLDGRLNFDAPNNIIRQYQNIGGNITYDDLVRFEKFITQTPPQL